MKQILSKSPHKYIAFVHRTFKLQKYIHYNFNSNRYKTFAQQMKALTQRIAYFHVGRRHIQKLAYTPQTCSSFNLLLQPEAAEQNKRKLSSKAVNRLFVSCFFSRIIGNNFPLSIYLSQTISFKRDILFNEEVVGEIQVKKDLGKNKYEIATLCKSVQGEILVEGIAIILQE